MAKAPELSRAQGCPSFPVAGSAVPAHVRSRVQPEISSWQSQQSPGSWQGVRSRHPPWCWIRPWIRQEEQEGSPLCFAALKIPNPAGFMDGWGYKGSPCSGQLPQAPPWAPQPHQQPEREVAAPKKWDLWAQYPTGARSQEKSSTRAFQKWQNPTSTGEQWEQRDPLGCATTLVGSRAQETADTRRKDLKRAKKNIFAPSIIPCPAKAAGASQEFWGGSLEIPGMQEFSGPAGSHLPARESAT